MIHFYFKRGRWRVTSGKTVVPAVDWWAAINQVKCLNHKLRMQQRELATQQAPAARPANHQ